MSHASADLIAAALELSDPDATPEELVVAARQLAEAHVTAPPQALAPLRERLAVLRTEIDSATDPLVRARMQTAAVELQGLLTKLEAGHAPTRP